ncbi:pyocin knob domain-containing protein [Pseudomonas piscis]|uniref:pyocin knob domain-containing protein n=1 Tax=Pseudomonas piscis TaxID=2614538 RepID=UPI0021D5CCF2|nr:hypothetical protein [Pseudomonas piscis]MCU7649471.1 hypothetical protein [Pseudomonas piscis]
MTLKTIKAGAQPNDGTGDNLRSGAQIINENFAELDQRAVLASTEIGKLDALTKALADKTGPGLDPAVRAILTRWGLGDSVTTLEERLLSWITVSALVFVFPQNGQNSLPTRETGYYVVHLQNADPKYAAQLAFNGSIGVMFRRVKAGDAWTPWTRLIQQGDFGVGSKDDAAYVGNNLNPNDYLTGGDVVGQFNMDGTLRTGALIVQAGSNATVCAQQFVDWATGKMYSRAKSSSTWNPWRAVVAVGDFGLGSSDMAPDMSANSASVTRFYRSFNDADSANLGLTAGIHLQRDNARSGDIALSWIDESAYFRISNSMGTRGAWRKLVKVGDFGVGAVSLQACNDANVIEATGDLLLHPGTLNGPTPGIYGTIRTTFYERSSGNFTQLAIATNGVGMFYRGCINGSVQPWMRINEESITNGNGTAVKFSDGTMICWHTSGAVRTTSNQVSAGVFLGEAEIFTFPVPFVTIGAVMPTVAYSATGYCWASVGEGNNPYQCRIVAFSHTNNAQYQAKYFAVGRWR